MQRLSVNKLKKSIFVITLLGFLILGISGTVTAQNSLDFGEVPVDTPKTIPLEIQNNNDVSITIICTVKDLKLVFSTYTRPVIIQAGLKYKLEVVFSPIEEGTYSGELRIFYFPSSSETGSKISIPPQIVALTGNGIVKKDPTIEDLLKFFNDSVQKGDLVGEGKGKSANNRLNAFGNMLEEAESDINDGALEEGLEHLRAAYRKINIFVVDGKNSDAIAKLKESDAIAELKEIIQYVMKDLSK